MNAWNFDITGLPTVLTLDFYRSMAALKDGGYHHTTSIQIYNEQFNHMHAKKKHPLQLHSFSGIQNAWWQLENYNFWAETDVIYLQDLISWLEKLNLESFYCV